MSEINPSSVYREYVTTGEDWAEKNAAAELLEGTLKTLRSQLAMKYKRAKSVAMNEAEHCALADEEYENHLVMSVEARKEANKAKVRYAATQALFEARRTAEASHRAATRAAT